MAPANYASHKLLSDDFDVNYERTPRRQWQPHSGDMQAPEMGKEETMRIYEDMLMRRLVG